MSIADKFNDCLEKIMQYNQEHSASYAAFVEAHFKAPAFEEIVSMGYEALPLISKAYVTLRHSESAFTTEEFKLLSEEDKQRTLKQGSTEFSLRVRSESEIVIFVLPELVEQIVGADYKIPEQIKRRPVELHRFSRQWLHLNMHKYIP